MQLAKVMATQPHGWHRDDTDWPLFICVLGTFRLLRTGQQMSGVNGTKMETLLATLALYHDAAVSRDHLLALLWPDRDPLLARQSLHSLIHAVRQRLGAALGDEPPIRSADSSYWLNREAGIGIDLVCYLAWVDQGDQQRRAGDQAAAMASYDHALRLYRGDLWSGQDVRAVLEREHLRATCLTLLARLADYAYSLDDYSACLAYAHHLLALDPCREDAHRLVMRCYVHQGERAQALRQYQTCKAILQTEFAIVPEPATEALFELVRRDPIRV